VIPADREPWTGTVRRREWRTGTLAGIRQQEYHGQRPRPCTVSCGGRIQVGDLCWRSLPGFPTGYACDLCGRRITTALLVAEARR
jgi:hypothetical protein